MSPTIPLRNGRSSSSARVITPETSHRFVLHDRGGRPGIVGHLVQLDDQPYTVIGVMPRAFAFPDSLDGFDQARQNQII
jgi:hypothetical protein